MNASADTLAAILAASPFSAGASEYRTLQAFELSICENLTSEGGTAEGGKSVREDQVVIFHA